MKSRWLATLIVLALVLASSNALAMNSTNYRLDWFTPLNTGGGGAMASASYAGNVTVGQTAIGEGGSTSYGVGLGFWYGMRDWFRLYLPLALRNYP